MTRTTWTLFLAAALAATLLAPATRAQVASAEDGIDRVVIAGRPPEHYRAPAAVLKRVDLAEGVNTLSGVPAFDWSYGCSATAAAMLVGYYDRHGYPNMYAGLADGGFCPLRNDGNPIGGSGHCSLSATEMGLDGRTTRGHVDDYWVAYGSTDPDPYITNGWPEHPWEGCTGDFMGTNQSALGNIDGATSFYYYSSGDPLYDYDPGPGDQDGCHGLRLFIESRGYSVQTNFNQYIRGQGTNPNKGFTFEQYKAEIDAGRPVLIHVENHTMLGFGYDEAGSLVYLYDTWDWSPHTMTWGGTYAGNQHFGVTVIRLEPLGALLSIPLEAGWNLVGYGVADSPSVPLEMVQVERGGETRSWAEGAAAGWVDHYLYYYEAGVGYLVAATEGGDDNHLRPGRGYWLKAYLDGVTLVIPEM